MEKLYDKIIWRNNTEPALDEDNLNAMSEAIDNIDDRVVSIGDDIFVIIPQIQAYLEQADNLVEAMETLSRNPPYIGANGHWYVWDTTTQGFVDSGVDASISVDIADITMLPAGYAPYVTNTGTDTDPVFHLFLPLGDSGVGIADITKTGTVGLVDTYTITLTDGTTYTFTVTNGRDGQGAGDMTKAVYDPDNAVADAGGIKLYIAANYLTVTGSNVGALFSLGTAPVTFGTRDPDYGQSMKSFTQGTDNAANQQNASAFGVECLAMGAGAHAVGYQSQASGSYSVAAGRGASANAAGKIALGSWNAPKTGAILEVGNGSSASNRSNAFEVYSDGKLSTDNGATKHDLNTIAENASAGATAAGTWTTAVSQIVGDTSCTIADEKITASSIVDDYCETASGKRVHVKQITVTTGRAVLSFDALEEAATFKLWIR